MANNYNVRLIKKEKIANDTMAFHWEKPDGFNYIAGHYCDLALADTPKQDLEENERAFSLATAPYEKEIVTATRMTGSAYKRVLKDLPEGAQATFDQPRGDFILYEDDSMPAVFITGGIGVTPVRSIVAQATYKKLSHDITLLYSNNTPEDAAYLSDLESYEQINPHFTFVPVMTDTNPGEWKGETGLINAEMVKRYVTDLQASTYFLTGPPDMVKDMRKMLVDNGVKDGNIRAEEFKGY